MTFNIVHHKLYVSNTNDIFRLRSQIGLTNAIVTHGHNLKIFVSQSKCDIVKFSFFHRVVNVWNSLDFNVVNAVNCHEFNERLSDIHLLPFLRGRAI